MKIGIVTINDYYNYGNRLQNYALSHVLQSRFHCSVRTLEGYRNPSSFEDNPTVWLKERIARQLCRIPSAAEKVLTADTIRWCRFETWSRKNIPRKQFYNCGQLPLTLRDQYDLFMAGSDQIWNYRFKNTRMEDCFLTFAREEQRIAVSASFGVETIPDDERDRFVSGLSGFAHISVREKTGASIVKDLISRDVPVLIDPVLMLDRREWLQVALKPVENRTGPYVLKYYLGDGGEDAVDEWAEKRGYRVVDLMDREEPLFMSGPGEFLTLIDNAELICSDSFHCIVLSIVFRKPFIAYERQGQENYMASRLHTLLDKFHLQKRWRTGMEEDRFLLCDYSETDGLLMKEQKKFLEYISAALNVY